MPAEVTLELAIFNMDLILTAIVSGPVPTGSPAATAMSSGAGQPRKLLPPAGSISEAVAGQVLYVYIIQ